MRSTPTEIAEGVFCHRTLMVNVFVVRSGSSWVFVDAGLNGYAESIRSAARSSLGTDAPPSAIILTHGHFDHVGSLQQLLRSWSCAVHAHPLERPYLTGRSPYPPPDPLVGRGAMALLSRLYPRGPIDVSPHLETLVEGTVPSLPEWEWIHTPGHSAGHISLFRRRDRVLIAGDAITTTKQESLIAVATQRQEIHGPPAYFTQDWRAASASVQRLDALGPDVLATGHGEAISGPALREGLRRFYGGF